MQTVHNHPRYELIDALRGFALFGILVVNMPLFRFDYDVNRSEKATYILAQYDEIASFYVDLFFVGKFYSIFSLLFGVGFYLFCRAKEKDVGKRLFKRRLVLLACFGLLHLLIWQGDILLLYGLLGFTLLPLSKYSNKTLLVFAVFCMLSPITWYALRMMYPALDPSQYFYEAGYHLDTVLHLEDEELTQAKVDHDFLWLIRSNISGIFYRYGYLLYTSRTWKVLAMFTLGILVAKLDLHKGLAKHRRVLWRTLLIGLIIGLPANYVLANLMQQPGYFMRTRHGIYQTIAFALGVVPLALAYCAAFSLFHQYGPGKQWLRMCAPVGRMALTNYITQTLICIFLFSAFGLDLHYVSLTTCVCLSLTIFVIQAVACRWWLSFFANGPLEWFWRGLTYGKFEPFGGKSIGQKNR